MVSSQMYAVCQGNNPQHVNTGGDTSLTIKRILTEHQSLKNRRRQFFGSTDKTMKQLLRDGDTTYGDTLVLGLFPAGLFPAVFSPSDFFTAGLFPARSLPR